MKKLLVAFLAVVILGSVAVAAIACGGTETTTTAAPTATTTAVTTATVAAMSVTEVNVIAAEVVASKQPHPDVTFTGPVLAVSEKADKYIVTVGTDTDKFSLSVSKTGVADAFGGAAALNLLIGKTVVVTGDVVLNPFGSAAEILLTEPSQVVVK